MSQPADTNENWRKQLRAARIPFYRCHPPRFRSYARSKGYLAKTDRLDAKLLAEYGLERSPKPTPPPDPLLASIAARMKRRQQLVRERTREKNRRLRERDKQLKAMMSVKGVGDISAVSLTLCAFEFAELRSKEAVSLFGLAPVAWESGKSFGKRSIRGGRSHIRAAPAKHVPVKHVLVKTGNGERGAGIQKRLSNLSSRISGNL